MSRSTALLLSTAFTALATPAAAQDIKPRILLIFDTSGSMGFDLATGEDTLGDNSREYPGNGGVSRLSVAKAVISDILQSTSEADFALMRYPQRQGLDINNGFERGAFTSYEGLMQNPLNYMGFCGGEAQPVADPEAPFSVVVPFASDNELAILSWMDGHENFPQDPELRAEGPTPIAESLRLAEVYYQGVLAADADLRCRKDYVILLTDGDESCVPAGINVQTELLNRTIALRQMNVVPAGGGGPPVMKDVKTYVVGFSVTNRMINQLNTLARAGGTAFGPNGQVDLIDGEAYTASDQAGLRQAFSRILAEAIPVEDCNGLDDDCDGRTDEGVLNSCGQCGGSPVEVCNDADDDCDGRTDEGVRNACGGCGAVPVEVCNGQDDDCDGAIDEDVVNACGGCAAVQAELCNNVDDDCDGQVDNLPGSDGPLARPCGVDVGECRSGEEICRAGEWLACTGVAPTEEVCDGRDNDCNGQTDELTRACGDALNIGEIGQCRIGRQACVFAACIADPTICDPDGWAFACEGGVGPVGGDLRRPGQQLRRRVGRGAHQRLRALRRHAARGLQRRGRQLRRPGGRERAVSAGVPVFRGRVRRALRRLDGVRRRVHLRVGLPRRGLLPPQRLRGQRLPGRPDVQPGDTRLRRPLPGHHLWRWGGLRIRAVRAGDLPPHRLPGRPALRRHRAVRA
jgi:hypothetical protein